MRSTVLVLPILLCACATAEVSDSEVPEPTAAYIALYPVVRLGSATIEFDLTLECIDTSLRHHTIFLPKTAPRQPVIVKAPPGACFASHVAAQSFRFVNARPHPQQTLFEAKAGQLNFPGAWTFTVSAAGSVSAPTSSTLSFVQYVEYGVKVENVARARTAIRSRFPKISEKLSLEYTRVEQGSGSSQ
jgi:hypothetical protein